MVDKIFDPKNRFKVKGDCKIHGMDIPDGAKATLWDSACIDRNLYDFERFNIPEVYFEIAKNSEENAVELISKINREKINNRHFQLVSDDNGSVWKYFTYYFKAIIFSSLGLEAHINSILPDKIKYEDYIKTSALSKNNKSSDILTLKLDWERECTLNQKIFEVLPAIKKFDVNKRNKLNKNKDVFLVLVKLRNILVHLKSKDIRTGMSDDGKRNTKKIWDLLIPRFKNKTLRFSPHNVAVQIVSDIKALIH